MLRNTLQSKIYSMLNLKGLEALIMLHLCFWKSSKF
uniref:Uncharacterized protein n=1 Tax=Rhizophora mucronata TaxID=61149 RepID=A0A2P2QAJ7_RHIMU